MREIIQALQKQGAPLNETGRVLAAAYDFVEAATPAAIRGPWTGTLTDGILGRNASQFAADLAINANALHQLLTVISATNPAVGETVLRQSQDCVQFVDGAAQEFRDELP